MLPLLTYCLGLWRPSFNIVHHGHLVPYLFLPMYRGGLQVHNFKQDCLIDYHLNIELAHYSICFSPQSTHRAQLQAP
jgi:hypothetical protein